MPSFHRAYRKLSRENQERVNAALKIFLMNPFDPRLRNHKLAGKRGDLHTMSAGYDLRIIYREKDGHTVIFFVNAGTHDEVY
jgi:mRNA-degrading endonuclease YafQ of YafQ-DinJ toxin-antitoxin module